jgi:hypothetical protein
MAFLEKLERKAVVDFRAFEVVCYQSQAEWFASYSEAPEMGWIKHEICRGAVRSPSQLLYLIGLALVDEDSQLQELDKSLLLDIARRIAQV